MRAKISGGKKVESCPECKGEMQMREMKIPGVDESTLPVMVCQDCGRRKWIKTEAFLSTRLAQVAEPTVKGLGKGTVNYMLVIPREIERALCIDEKSTVELTVEGFDRLAIKILNNS